MIEELSKVRDEANGQFAYGEKVAYTECYEKLGIWKEAKKYGWEEDIEKKFPLWKKMYMKGTLQISVKMNNENRIVKNRNNWFPNRIGFYTTISGGKKKEEWEFRAFFA